MGPLKLASSYEATAAAASYTDVSAAYMDLDSGVTFAQFGAKGPGSLGLKLRTVLAGVALTVMTFAANGAATLAGDLSLPGTLVFTGAGGASPGTAAVFYDATAGLVLNAKAGSAFQFYLQNTSGATLITSPIGTRQLVFGNDPGGAQNFRFGGDIGLGGQLHISTSTAQVLNLTSTDANGIYTTYLNGGAAVGDIGNGKQLFGGATGDFGMTSRSGKLLLGSQGSVVALTIDSASTTIKLASLAGTGSRTVVAAADGTLSAP